MTLALNELPVDYIEHTRWEYSLDEALLLSSFGEAEHLQSLLASPTKGIFFDVNHPSDCSRRLQGEPIQLPGSSEKIV